MKKVLTMVCLVVFGFSMARAATADINYRVLHSFDGLNGSFPYGHLTSDGPRLYGMTAGDSIRNTGMVFSILPDGSDYTILRHFEGQAPSAGQPGDGQWPHGSLMVQNGTLYGITWAGGCFANNCANVDNTGCGTLFSQKTDGTAYDMFWEFACGQGDEGLALPNAHFVSDGNRLYSTASLGGPHGFFGSGGVFAVQPDGTGFQILHAFDENSPADGSEVRGGLALEDGVLYGTTDTGGANGLGTVFSVRTDGSGFTTLHHFSGPDGAFPGATPHVVGDTLYAVTINGGAHNNGVVFSMGLDGSDYQVLHDFTADESGPTEGVIEVFGRLYGATTGTGDPTYGIIYSLRSDGSDYQVLHRVEVEDGFWVDGRLLYQNGVFYGLAARGGPNNSGALFAFDRPIPEFVNVPAFSPWGLAGFILLVGGAAVWINRRKSRARV